MLRAAALSGCEKMDCPDLSPNLLTSSATRVSCHTIALCSGLPVFLFHSTVVSRWFVIPIAARSPAFSRASAIASAITSCVRCPDFFRVVLHPSRLRINLPVLLLRAGHNFSCGVKHNKARARGSLINGANVFAHTAFLAAAPD